MALLPASTPEVKAPEFDAQFRDSGVKKGTTLLPTEPSSKTRERVFSVLNGEFQTAQDKK